MKIDIPIIVRELKEHRNIKNDVLDFLDKQNYTSVKTNDDVIGKTDYFVDVGEKRDYWEFLYPYIWPITLDVCKKEFHYDDNNSGKILNCWFQQYYRNGTHTWHRHACSSINAIYFVELPKNNSTEFKLPQSEKLYRTEAEEGDIIFFPSFLVHRSSVNTTSKRKTVVAFNMA